MKEEILKSSFNSQNQPNKLYNDILKQLANGSIRIKLILEQGEIRSANYIEGSQGWRLTPTSSEFN